MFDPTDFPPGTTADELRAPDDHPDYAIALDRSRSLADRRAAYVRWRDDMQPHWHPNRPRHWHPGGNQPHQH